MLVLEIVFVEQCEVCVCLDFVAIFFFPPWPLSSLVRTPWGGLSVFLKGLGVGFGDSFCRTV